MSAAAKTAKSFGPQDLTKAVELPAAAWGVDRLQEFAVQQHKQIEAKEKRLTYLYWLLGAALSFLRKQFAHGQWERFLESAQITPTRAAKARAIYGAFDEVDKVQDLTVDEAYSRRKRKPPKSSTKTKRKAKTVAASSNTPKTFQVSLHDVVEQAETFPSDCLQRFPERRQELLNALTAAIAKLEALRNRLTPATKIDAQ